MLVNVSAALKSIGDSVRFHVEEDKPSEKQLERMSDETSFSNVSVDGHTVGAGESVYVRATVKATARLVCVRCLRGFEQPVETAISEIYAREADPNDPEKELFQGFSVDIEEQVYSALLMSLPIRTLCDEGCKGLCDHCGADLNEGDCGCHEDTDEQ